MELNIYTSDVKDFDKEVDRKFDVSEEFGTGIFDDDNRISLDNYNYHLEPFTYIGIIADMQEQLNAQNDKINDLNSRLYNVEKHNER